MKSWLRNNLGLVLLLLILIPIVLTNLITNSYLIGWDNFSVSLDLKTNIVRTIFSTWRAYRGLGVASDSEVVDITRQFIYVLFSPLPQNYISQIYVIFTLILGSTGTYKLIRFIIKEKQKNSLYRELISFFSTILYLFNLNTVGTYFFPMPMFIGRFAYFPWVILTFYKYLEKPQRKNLFYFALINLFATGSYLTATVFVTLSLLLFIIGLFNIKKLKNLAILASVFILVNSFWILPFSDYTHRKSPLIPLASTFADVNETQLNEKPSNFDWKYIISVYPSFLHNQSAANKEGEHINLHPIIEQLNPQKLTNWSTMLLVLLGLIGIIPCLLSKNKKIVSVPLIILLSLFMIRKDYPPFGFMYEWLGNHIPYFKIVFRFGDTKFNNIIAMFSAISIGILFNWIIEKSKSKIYKIIILAMLIAISLFPTYQFRFFFNRNLMSELMRTQIPDPYFQIAETINQDNQNGRVMHLPVDKMSYWKSHSWGYFGSSFIAFLSQKPVLDRTFAPASLENDFVDQELFKIVENAHNIKDEKQLEQRAQNFARLLTVTNTLYVIDDKTVTIHNTQDDITLWGEFLQQDFDAILNKAREMEIIELVSTYQIDHLESDNEINLYKTTISNQSQTLDKAQQITINQDNFLNLSVSQKTNTIQPEKNKGLVFPFKQTSLIFQDNGNSLKATLGSPIPTGKISLSQNDNQHVLEIYASKDDKDLIITTQELTSPFEKSRNSSQSAQIPLDEVEPYLEKKSNTNNIASDWHTLSFKDINQVRLAIGPTVIPLPFELSDTPQLISTVTVDDMPIQLSLLVPDENIDISTSRFKYTDDPNCFKDKLEDYSSKLNLSTNNLELSTTDGTSCVIQSILLKDTIPYFEISFDYNLSSDDNDKQNSPKIITPSKNQQELLEIVDSLPTLSYFSACILDINSNTDHCSNTHNTINPTAKHVTLIPAYARDQDPRLQISLPTINHQTNTLSISNIELTEYQEVFTQEIDIENTSYDSKAEISSPITEVTIPKSLSPESYYFNPNTDALRVYNEPCSGAASYRTAKLSLDDQTLLYTHDCFNGLYTIVPFNSDHFYLWQIDYHLFSGKFPRFSLLADNTYIDQYLSWNQGYPNIAEFKDLQIANYPQFFRSQTFEEYAKEKLENPKYQSASTYYYPQQGLQDIHSHQYGIIQNSQNQGIFSVKNMNIVQLPTFWQDISIIPDDTQPVREFDQSDYQIEEILPSLWQIDIKRPQNNSYGEVLLPFSQAYDERWKLYGVNSPISAILGKKQSLAEHVKVNGITNGWIIPTSDLEGAENTTYFAFYTPERLAIIGWILTLSTLLTLCLLVIVKRKKP